ncbi:hypothetical protein EXIGLDRAFT_759784 [Exidia glandulosa HHB12029]|uniref:Adipose-regulatory protein n=1 Tax=Exidia glandulosa HHB12029 TaxID=1314781 RepID=A0A165PTV5_EXIGL|nr:hypothetical protein EXIGLDRAFT_759784 [Exidia glandulosa HHB12029]
MYAQRQRRRAEKQQAAPTFASLLLAPWYYLLDVVWSESKLAIPYLVPLALGVLLLPVLALFSLGAGWMVWTSVPVGWREPIFLQYGDGTPHGETVLRALVADQAYNIALHMLVPASQSNYDLGNFMTSLVLSTISNKTIISASKPSVILPPKTSLLSLRTPQTVVHHVQLLKDFVPGATRLLASVEIGRKDMWRSLGTGAGREVTVFEAYLVGEVKLSGVRALIAAFPILTTLVATIAFFAFSVMGLLAFAGAYSYIAATSRPVDAQPSKPAIEPLVTPKAEIEPASLLTPSTTSDDDDDRSSESSGSTEKEMVMVKSEAEEESTSTSLLRRRLSQPFSESGSEA